MAKRGAFSVIELNGMRIKADEIDSILLEALQQPPDTPIEKSLTRKHADKMA